MGSRVPMTFGLRVLASLKWPAFYLDAKILARASILADLGSNARKGYPLSVNYSPSICIVGSGPSGCYVAQFLAKRWPESEITILERLEKPYGLAIYGVAPDHIGTRAVTKQFDRLWQTDEIKFFGNVEVGRELTLEQLRKNFDVVVLATGLHQDKRLNIPGAELSGVVGAGRVTRLINGHPEEVQGEFSIGENLVIIGQGNVAIDLVRLTLTRPDDLANFGVPRDIVASIHHSTLKKISVVGRSGCQDAKFDLAMIKELGRLFGVRFNAVGLNETALDEKSLAIADLIKNSPNESQVEVTFYFGFDPTGFEGESGVERVKFSATSVSSDLLTLEADTVLTAVGFEERDDAVIRRADLMGEHSILESGYLDSGLYCVGWFRRGPNGTIPANRTDAKLVSEKIIQDFENGTGSQKVGRKAVARLL
jgi:ferredoxin--NADP+ reductase